MSSTIDNILTGYNSTKRICPMPQSWNQMYNLLKGKQRKGMGWEPALPLILAAWDDTPYFAKILRFREHLEWAEKQGQLDEIVAYLESLSEKDWLHEGE